MTVFSEGHVFEGPGGQSYVLTRDVEAGEAVAVQHFRPRGGAPEPVAGHLMPEWLWDQINGKAAR